MKFFQSLQLTCLIRFSFIAGFGWILDFSMHRVLLSIHIRVAVANVVRVLIGVTFAYLMSVRAVFYYESTLLVTKFLMYVFYNAFIILFLLFSIGYLSKYFNTSSIYMKCYVTTLTMVMKIRANEKINKYIYIKLSSGFLSP